METQRLSGRKIFILMIATVFVLSFFLPVFGTGTAQAASSPLIMIDPGHGWKYRDTDDKYISDSGNIGLDGTREYDLVMLTTPLLIRELQKRGYEVVTTLPVLDDVKSYTSPPNVSLLGRVTASNRVNADLFVSVHYNSWESSSARGSLVIYDDKQLTMMPERPNQPADAETAGSDLSRADAVQALSLDLAGMIRDEYYKMSWTKGNRSTGIQSQNKDSVTHYNNAPAVILELGFLSNATDLKYAKDAQKRASMVQATADGIDAYFKEHPVDGKDTPGETTESTKIGSFALGASSPTTMGEFVMRAKKVTADAGVRKVMFRVYAPDGTVKDYTAVDEGSGSWAGTFKTSDFNYQTGIYKFVAYAYDKSGNSPVKTQTHKIRINKEKVKPKIGSVSVPASTTSTSFLATAKKVTDASGIQAVQFHLWNNKNAKVVQKFNAKQDASGNWSATINLSKFKDAPGTYSIKSVARDNWKNMAAVTKTVVVKKPVVAEKPVLGQLVFGAENPTNTSRFTVRAQSVKNAKSVSFKVWNKDKDESVVPAQVIQGTKKGTDNYQFTLDVENFGGYFGTYCVQVYAKDSLGKQHRLKTDEITIKTLLTQTPIMGVPQATVDQMVSFFKASGRTYPVYYEQAPRNISLQQFAQMYYDVAVDEGVRPEVAWIQMCLETGYLQFGGDVSESQFNFAGLGATGGGEPGYNFAEVYGDNATGMRYGVIGHVQHLKCYASTKDAHYTVEGKPVDPRWDAVVSIDRRGVAPYVEDLENNWAMSSGYSKMLYDCLQQLMGMQAATMEDVPVADAVEEPVANATDAVEPMQQDEPETADVEPVQDDLPPQDEEQEPPVRETVALPPQKTKAPQPASEDADE